MTRIVKRRPISGLLLSSMLATAALGGCSSQGAPRADLSANKAQIAMTKGETDKAIAHAEAAVLAEPRNAAYRAVLGAGYMDAGRFQSAATSFDDAMSLGDTSPRTALSLALAEIALGNKPRALSVLNDWRNEISADDLGLAYALAGDADRGVKILGDVLRAGHATPKVRQNLAYSYALQGNWKAARIMVSEDVPADQIDARISEWARMARPEDHHQRVATLLTVPVRGDTGQPQTLALSNHPSNQQLASEAAALATAQASVPETTPDAPAPLAKPIENYAFAAPGKAELPPLAVATTPRVAVEQQTTNTVAKPEDFEAAFATRAPAGATPAQVVADAARFISEPVVQKMPGRFGATKTTADATTATKPRVAKADIQPRVAGKVESVGATRAIASAASSSNTPNSVPGGSHLVQLGSFSSEQGARRAWGIYAKRYDLEGRDMVITKAKVRGRHYYRVSAAGFGSGDARTMCSSVKSKGHGCIAWAANSPLPGAIDRVDDATRMAAR